jgi:hypothetical protein
MTPTRDGPPFECVNPIESPVLTDYWLALLPPDVEEVVETHLLSCDTCGHRLREAIALADALRALARSGSLQVVVSDQFVAHAADMGLRVREYSLQPGESVQCTVSADDDLLVARLGADLTGASRIDLRWCDRNGVERQRLQDVAVRSEIGNVICQQSITWAKAAPTGTMIARLVAVDDEGGERLLGEYTFNHTRTIPGPPGWHPPEP